jgi:DNA-binding NarL/FixJ family response regulator
VSIRVLFAGLPPMLHGVFEDAIRDQPDMDLVGAATEPLDILIAAGQTKANVVLLAVPDGDLPGVASHLLSEYQHIKVLAVSLHSQHAFLYQLRAELVPLGEASPSGLLEAIRAAVNGEVA